MSMTVFMIWQMIGIFCAYFGVTLVLPLIVFRSLLRGKTVTNQILFSYLIGNFYIITMVQILQLLKISHTITLILATIVPAYIVWVKLNKVEVVKAATEVGTNVKRVTEKHMGMKTAGVRIKRLIWREGTKCAKSVKKFLVANWLEVLLQVGLLCILFWGYGVSVIEAYGYTASDIPVHNWWINALGDNNIFVDGVYPHGYHCMIYYLHEVFGIDTYIILSLFAFVQIVCVHFALLYFLRLCCKAKYLPYAGVFLYAAGDFFIVASYERFYSTLPQEFGMIFILPAIYYGFEFFELRRKEAEKGEKKKDSLLSLIGFALSFGLTLSVHFYNTIIAGLFCVAMALGYLFLFVKKQYFCNVIVTCMISVLIAVLPMGIAFATGTPLQGSLYWATSVIAGEEWEGGATDETKESVFSEEEVTNQADKVPDGKEDLDTLQEVPQGTVQSDVEMQPKISLKQRILKLPEILNNGMKEFTWNYEKDIFCKVFWGLLIFLIFAGIFSIIMKRFTYGAMLITDAIYAVLMLVLLSASSLGLPMLMDPGRACIYFAYFVPVVLVMPVDAVLNGGATFFKCPLLKEIVSILVLGVSVLLILFTGNYKERKLPTKFETNEAITCLTNILRSEPDCTWTICSANDEFRMCEENGYHYETIVFLREIEGWSKDTIVTLPTEKVFFFVEKDCTVANGYMGTDKVSEDGAKKRLSYAGGLAPYQGENRWITMSHMYYWAQEMLRMYPNEMKVYMETDNFVCYVLEQNTYSLVNLAIDYGYNTGEK